MKYFYVDFSDKDLTLDDEGNVLVHNSLSGFTKVDALQGEERENAIAKVLSEAREMYKVPAFDLNNLSEEDMDFIDSQVLPKSEYTREELASRAGKTRAEVFGSVRPEKEQPTR